MNNLSGKRYGMLEIISYHHFEKMPSEGIRYFWNCRCDCGNEKVIGLNGLYGKTISCGCYHSASLRKAKKINRYIFYGDYIEGITEKGESFYFDLEDYDKIKNFYWHIEDGYARHRIRVEGKKRKRIYLHRVILDIDDNSIIIDHANRNKSDNRKSNLRLANKAQNYINSKTPVNSPFGFKGISRRGRKFISTLDNKEIGAFDNIDDAIEARINKEIELFGEFSPFYNQSNT